MEFGINQSIYQIRGKKKNCLVYILELKGEKKMFKKYIYMYCIRPSSHIPTPTSHVIQCRNFASPSCESSTPLATQLSVDPTQAEGSPTASSHVQHVTIIALDNPIPPLLLKFFAAQWTKRSFLSFQMAYKHTKVYIKVV
jgi:hypothetical protein